MGTIDILREPSIPVGAVVIVLLIVFVLIEVRLALR